MKQIYVGSTQRTKLFVDIKKNLLPPQILLAVVPILMVCISILFADKIFLRTEGSMSPVAFITTGSSSGSGVLISNNRLLTAAHVVNDMVQGDLCEVVFCDPNNPETLPIHAAAELITAGNVKKNSLSNTDFALMQIHYVDASKFAKAYSLGSSKEVKVKDEVHAIGFPGTHTFFESFLSAETAPGEIQNISGGWLNDPEFFVASCNITHGYSGGALEDKNGRLIGIVIGGFTDPQNPNYSQKFFLKIDGIKKALSL